MKSLVNTAHDDRTRAAIYRFAKGWRGGRDPVMSCIADAARKGLTLNPTQVLYCDRKRQRFDSIEAARERRCAS